VQVVFDDGAKYLAQHKTEFDIIIVDSSDPVGTDGPLSLAHTDTLCRPCRVAVYPELLPER
jgi:spermidine synthase